MGVYFDGVVTGSAAIDLVSPFHVLYVAADVIGVGPGVGQMGADVAGHLSRVGWFALGDRFDIGEGVFDRWRDPVWFNWEHTLWTPMPSTDAGGGGLTVVAPRLLYYISSGTTVHLHVYGA